MDQHTQKFSINYFSLIMFQSRILWIGTNGYKWDKYNNGQKPTKKVGSAVRILK